MLGVFILLAVVCVFLAIFIIRLRDLREMGPARDAYQSESVVFSSPVHVRHRRQDGTLSRTLPLMEIVIHEAIFRGVVGSSFSGGSPGVVLVFPGQRLDNVSITSDVFITTGHFEH